MVSIVPLCVTDPLMKSPFAPQGGEGIYILFLRKIVSLFVYLYIYFWQI